MQLVIWDFIGTAIWVAGFTFEAVADRQLARFKSDPANRSRVMRSGLWAYSRHPNYFGESLVWWGIFLMAASDPRNLWTVVGPVTILFLLLKVSGVTLTEKTIAERRPEYRDYVRSTNAFFPGRTRRGGE
jgi:steroid 5-alpha reductase family enzyme